MMRGRRVAISDVTLRSLSRITPPENGRLGRLLPIVETLDQAGFAAIEVWGLVPVAHALKWWNESPWERLRAICSRIQRARPQMELAGTSLVGIRPCPRRLMHDLIARAADCGVRSFLVYEPLNDVGGLESALEICRGLGVEIRLGLVCEDPRGGAARTVELAERLQALRPDAICVKTGKGLGPAPLQALVGEVRRAVSLPLEVDVDNAGGMGAFSAALSVSAGADLVYASASPNWMDLAAVSVATVRNILEGAGVETGLRASLVAQVTQHFGTLGQIDGGQVAVELELARYWPEALELPAGTLHRLALRLEEQGALPRLGEVVRETLGVLADMGISSVVWPLAEVAAAQAVLNVLYGRRWHIVPDEMRAYLRGAYGSAPRPVAPEVLQAVFGSEGLAVEEAEQSGWEGDQFPGGSAADTVGVASDSREAEDALLLELAPEEACGFLSRRADLAKVATETSREERETEGLGAIEEWERFGPAELRELVAIFEASEIEELTVETAGAKVSLRKAGSPSASSEGAAPGSAAALAGGSASTEGVSAVTAEAPLGENEHVVRAPMVGTFYRGHSPEAPPLVVQGQRVAVGDPLCVLEAMKLLNEVVADVSGVVTAILVEDGAPVEYGQPLFVIETVGE